MSYFQSFSNCYDNNHVADDSSTVFDADTVTPDEVPSLPAMPPLPTLTATETATATTDYFYNNNVTISSIPHSSQNESPQSFTSELLRRINSQRSLAMPSTATATATRDGEVSTNESSSSSSKKRSIIINSSSSHQSTKRPRQSSRRNRQQPQDQSYVDKSDSEVDDENELEDYEPNEAVINQSSSSSSSSQISTKRQRQNELKWKSKFEKLCDYKRLHGHANVPRNNKELGKWVNNQRQQYKKLKKNGKAQITHERIQTLESIGFEWELSKWNERFNELKVYKEKYGRTNVPKRWKDNKELGVWVQTQRTEYKRFKKNGKGKITPERIEMLNSIGFEWVSQYKAPRNESAWNERFNELKAYKEEYKDTNVPQRWEDNKELGNWVSTQRVEYKKFQENKKTFLTPERIEMLNSIGFEWVCQKYESSWNKRFNELKEYKEKYERTDVPYRWEDNKELGKWVSTQRSEYKKFKKNEKAYITPERINMLNSIGFQWECRPGPAPRS